jgi:hypothetical protein
MAITVMRHLLPLAVLLGMAGSTASAEAEDDRAHAEMAAALVAQADLHPTPVSLPVMAAAPRHAAAASAVQRGTGARGANEAAGAVANQASERAQAQAGSQAVAHQAQAAAAAAAGQAQSQAAKERAAHPRPR